MPGAVHVGVDSQSRRKILPERKLLVPFSRASKRRVNMTETMKLEEARMIANEFMEKIKGECIRAEVVGSVRRGKKEVHDIDVVAVPKSKMFLFSVMAKMRGEKIIRIDYKGAEIDIYIANDVNYEVLRLIRTGSAVHNIKLCSLAKDRCWSLKANGDGLFDSNGMLIDNTERGILEKLLGKYVEPGDRE